VHRCRYVYNDVDWLRAPLGDMPRLCADPSSAAARVTVTTNRAGMRIDQLPD
jgi:hypothetical protein